MTNDKGSEITNANGIPKTLLVPKGVERRSSSNEFRVSTTKEKKVSSGENRKKEKSREFFFVTKGTSELKWQRAKSVVGALEVKSEPHFQPKEDMKPLYRDGEEFKTQFEHALQAWEDLKLREKFIKACNDLPDTVCCCGLSQEDSSSTIKQYVTLLNDGWVKYANKKLVSRGFKIDTFHWNWQNTTGKSGTNILLIRFFELSTYKFRRASVEGSLDLDDMLLDAEDKDNNSSHYSVSHNSGENDDNSPVER
mmetsp:Transcript_23126/g.25954  ORF Transcript_23126/g.25954 Transcript_23126/m.25954 type:complete len:252 (-) Transcript_23126:267-1022(-)